VTNTFIGPLPANATETIVLTTPPLNIALDFALILLVWTGGLTTGASVTSHVWRLRRGTTLTGAQVGANPLQVTVAAGNFSPATGFYFDTPGAVAGQQYTLTLTQTAATGAGVWSDGALLAFML
jgi:hypothetical protein